MPRMQPWIQLPCPLPSVNELSLNAHTFCTAPDWQHPPAGEHATRTSLGTSKIPNGLVGREEAGSCKAALSEITSFSQPIFCLHCTIFCGGCAWKKKPQHTFCVHNQKGQIRGVQAHLILAFPNFHQLRFSELLGMWIYTIHIYAHKHLFGLHA